MINVKLNTSGPKLNSWKAQSLIRALAPIQSDERAKSEPDLWFTKLIEPSQPALAPGVWLELAPNQNSLTITDDKICQNHLVFLVAELEGDV